METPREDGRRSAFWFGFALYASTNLLLRWLAWTLFHGHGVYGWERPGLGELALAVGSAVLPAFVAAWLGYWITRGLGRFTTTALGNVLPALAFFVYLEADMAWVHFSQTHLAWRDVHMFLTESWSDHFGLRTSDFLRQALLIGGHGLLLFGAWRVAGTSFVLRLPRPRPTLVTALVLAAFLTDFVAVARVLSRPSGNEQWVELSAKNPVRLRLFDDWRHAFSANADDLVAARAAFVEQEPAGRPLDGPSDVAGEAPAVAPHDMLLIVIESLSRRYADRDAMPYLDELAGRGLRATARAVPPLLQETAKARHGHIGGGAELQRILQSGRSIAHKGRRQL